MMTGGEMKTCRTCSRPLPLASFHRRRDAKDGRQSRCRDCTNEHERARRLSSLTPEQHRERERRAQLTDEDKRARRRAYDRAYRAAHPEVAWRSLYRQRVKRYGLEPIEEPFTKADVIDRYGDGCWHCTDGEFEELDHFPVPVADGGSHTLENVRPACRRSNVQGARGARLCRELRAERDQIIADTEALFDEHRERLGLEPSA